MFIQLNLSAIALAGVAAWKRVKPVVIRDAVLLPAAGFDCTGRRISFQSFLRYGLPVMAVQLISAGCLCQLFGFYLKEEGRRKKEEGRRKKEEEEGRRKKEEGRRKKEEGRGKKEEGRRKKEEGRRKKNWLVILKHLNSIQF